MYHHHYWLSYISLTIFITVLLSTVIVISVLCVCVMVPWGLDSYWLTLRRGVRGGAVYTLHCTGQLWHISSSLVTILISLSGTSTSGQTTQTQHWPYLLSHRYKLISVLVACVGGPISRQTAWPASTPTARSTCSCKSSYLQIRTCPFVWVFALVYSTTYWTVFIYRISHYHFHL